MAATHTNKDVQEALAALKYDVGDIDGAIGAKSSAAIAKFQEDKGLTVNGIPDNATLKALFPSSIETGPRTIQATAMDWILNLVKSKSAWAAAAGAAAIVAFVNTRFGIQLPPDIVNLITTVLALAIAALVGLFQTFYNTPHMTTKQPAVVQKPAEFTP
jgi:peptidoglycan hydrolase-like protein with peptidoglycan-binding domain